MPWSRNRRQDRAASGLCVQRDRSCGPPEPLEPFRSSDLNDRLCSSSDAILCNEREPARKVSEPVPRAARSVQPVLRPVVGLGGGAVLPARDRARHRDRMDAPGRLRRAGCSITSNSVSSSVVTDSAPMKIWINPACPTPSAAELYRGLDSAAVSWCFLSLEASFSRSVPSPCFISFRRPRSGSSSFVLPLIKQCWCDISCCRSFVASSLRWLPN